MRLICAADLARLHVLSYITSIMTERRLKTLDLFSGIGGFSISLKSISNVVAYCENNEDCRRVLQRAMSNCQIEKAPIFRDITQLKAQDLPSGINMLTAGFPCQDISQGSKTRTGIQGFRSGLFYHVIRLAEAIPTVKVVFLENSSLITLRGLEAVIASLKQLGFDNIVWSIFSSTEVDAPHERKRWYCLASRSGIQLERTVYRCTTRWRQVPKTVPRVVPLNAPEARKANARYKMLGNAVIPSLTRLAWNSLSSTVKAKTTNKALVISVNGEAVSDYYRTKRLPQTDFKIAVSDGQKKYLKARWATPSCSWLTAYALNDRSAKVLINQILYEASTQTLMKNLTGRKFLDKPQAAWKVNPQFIEWMMGYPINWTSTGA